MGAKHTYLDRSQENTNEEVLKRAAVAMRKSKRGENDRERLERERLNLPRKKKQTDSNLLNGYITRLRGP